MTHIRGTKNYSKRCVHIDGASTQLDCSYKMLSKATVNSLWLLDMEYGVICMIFKKWHVLDLQIL
jgi:hypothetical protein